MDTLKEEIKEAIEAHNDWKRELIETINSGMLETPVDIIQKDKECEFGRWLLSSKNLAQEKSTATYHEIVVLHADFHKLAGKIASLAVAGKKAEAKKLMVEGGQYASLSAKLIKALNDWDVNKK